MPLDKSKTKKAISKNIETEQNAGKPHDQAVAIALHTAHPNEKGYAEGGTISEEPGIQDATLSDFLLPLLMGNAAPEMAEGMAPALKGLGEAGEVTLGKAAPEMEGLASKIQPFSKGVMGKGTPNEMTIWGVKGDPEAIAKLGYGPDPASVPEHILKQHGILPETSINASTQNAPNSYADGGIVESLRNLMGRKESIESGKKEAITANNIDPVITSSNTASGYAQGGLVQEENPNAFYKQVGEATSQGINHDMDAVKDFLMQMFGKAQNGPVVEDSTLGTQDTGLQGLANKAAGTPSNAPSRGYADGGEVLDDVQGVPSQPPPIQFDPTVGLPPTPPPQAPVQAPNTAITDYLSQQKAAIGQYGPEQQMAVSKAILGQQNGLRGSLANAGAGLGDAIVQGVARAGNPGFQQNLQNRQDKQAELQLNALKGAREANIQNIEQGQKLDAMDPNSKLSKASQQSNGLFLSALGFDPKTISMMSASQIPEAISTIKDLGIKDRELAVARFKAQIEANQLAETSRHNVAEEKNKGKELVETAKEHGVQAGLKGEEIRTGELEKAAAVPFLSRVAQTVGLNPAGAKLQKEAVPGSEDTMTPDVLKYAATHQITPQQALAIKNKRLGLQ